MSYAIIPFILSPPILIAMLGRRGPMSTWYLWKFFLHAMQVPLIVAGVTYAARWLLQPKSQVVGLVMLMPVSVLAALLLMLATSYGRRHLRESLEVLKHLRRRPASQTS
jgi:hypothetical protein